MKYKPCKNEFWNEKQAKELFQIFPFYIALIGKPKIKHLSNIKLLHELPFYDELSVGEISKAFKRYARSYKVEIIESKDLLVQVEASKSSIKDLFNDLLNEMKGFRYQITVTVLLSKHKINGDIEYAPVYFNSATKIVINSDKYMLDKSFQEILYRIDNWINEGSRWIIESIEVQHVSFSVYSPLSGSTYIELPNKLKNVMKGLINIKNNDNKCFLWCHIRHLNLVKTHPERIMKEDKNMINDLKYEGIKFHVSKKDYCRIERQNNICINVFCYENGLPCPVYLSDQKFGDSMDLLLISDASKSHYVYIKDFNRFICNKTKSKNKKYFCKCCLQCFSSEKVLIEHKENCLIINGKQSVKLKCGSISFKNYFKQSPVLFKIYTDFECILKRVRGSHKNNGSYT